MERETESEKTLSSLDGMQRAAMPAALRERIISAMPLRTGRTIPLRRPFVLLMAAGLALLIGLNFYSLAAHSRAEKTGSVIAAPANPLGDEYFAPAPSI